MGLLFFVACCFLTSCQVSEQTTYALLGQMLYLNPHVNGGQSTTGNILWKHNGNKAVEYTGNQQTEYSSFKNRVVLDWISAELNVSKLTYEDSGTYVLEATINEKLEVRHYAVEVIDKVSKPTISCNATDLSGALTCSLKPTPHQSLVKFEWHFDGRNVQPGPNLTISLGGKHDAKDYTCVVSNPLGKETATFIAKDCHTGSNVALVVGISVAAIITLLLVLLSVLTLYCKRNNKACFAEKKQPPGAKEELHYGEGDESKILLDRAPTLPSTQRLHHQVPENQEDNRPQAGWVKKNVAKFEGSLRLGSRPNTQTAWKKKANENEDAKSPHTNGIPPSPAQPRSPLTQHSPDLGAEDTADEHLEDAKADQVNRETSENNVRESDSPRNEFVDESVEEKQPSPAPELDSETEREQDSDSYQEKTRTREEDQIMDKTVCEDESESESVGDGKEIDTEQIPSPDTSQQPRSPTQTKPDSTKTNTSRESLNTPHADPDQEPESKTRHDSDVSEGQSDSCTAEAGKGEDEGKSAEKNEAGEEKQGNENLREDAKGQGKAEAAE